MRQRYIFYLLAAVAAIALIAGVTYGVPKVIERVVLWVWGKPTRGAVLAFGDGLGCAILSLYWGAKRGLLLYLALTGVELTAFHEALFRFRDLLYFEDLVPTA